MWHGRPRPCDGFELPESRSRKSPSYPFHNSLLPKDLHDTVAQPRATVSQNHFLDGQSEKEDYSLSLFAEQSDYVIGGDDSLQVLLVINHRQRIQVVFVHQFGDPVLLIVLIDKNQRLGG